MNITCQLCNNSKVFCKCHHCEIFLCSQCDEAQHFSHKSGASNLTYDSSNDYSTHKRVRICEECEESECAIHCFGCEQFQCAQCNNRLHKKGARQKHKRKSVSSLLDNPQSYMKRSETAEVSSGVQTGQNEQEKSSLIGIIGSGTLAANERVFKNWNQERSRGDFVTGSESSRKNSGDMEYGNESYQQEDDYEEENSHQSSSLYYRSGSNKNIGGRSRDRGSKKPPSVKEGYTSGGRGTSSGLQQHYLSSGKQGKQGNLREGKRGSYSSGGSSGGGNAQNKGNYQNYKHSNDHYYNQYLGGASKNQGKYRKNNYYDNQYSSSEKLLSTGGQGGSANIQDPIPAQYFDGGDGHTVFIPIFQSFIRCDSNIQDMVSIQKELFEFGRKGDLLIDYDVFKEALMSRFQYKDKQCQDLIDLALDQGIIHQTKRNFANMRTLNFISLQLDIISHECITWVLNSLQKDEMTPTERAVQSRIKEAFAFKISNQLWECIMESLQDKSIVSSQQQQLQQKQDTSSSTYQRQVKAVNISGTTNSQYKVTTVKEHPNSSHSIEKQEKKYKQTYNDYYQTSQQSKYYQQKYPQYIYQDKKQQQEFEFIIKEIEEDPSIGQMTKVIYPKNVEEWVGINQDTEVINFEQYDELKTFLYNYFCGNYEEQTQEEEKWSSSLENALSKNVLNTQTSSATINQPSIHGGVDYEEVRAIPGGRYGCAQFVKICGPPSLKKLSLGKLACLVQYAVKEDVLRYHKTLLVWTTTVDKHKKLAEEMQKESQKNATVAAKLNVVKDALLEILAESKTGMSLAQLPLYLRRKLPFVLDLNELGFPKLKDLILSMSDKIKLELRGHNHPFAYLVKSGRYVHSASNSDDFQNIPKNKGFIKSSQHHLSEDVNINRHLNNALALNESKVKTVLTAFFNLMRERPAGVKSDEIAQQLTSKIGFEFNFKDFGCYSLLEFLKKFIMPTLDIEIVSSTSNEDDTFLIRSKQFFMNNYNQIMGTDSQNNTTANTTAPNIQLSDQKQSPQFMVSPQTQQIKERMIRTDSASSSINYQYIPNHQSLYGDMNSPTTSQYQLNISHIRYNTADTTDMLGGTATTNTASKQQQKQQEQQAHYQKPPLAPLTAQQLQQQQVQQYQQYANNQQYQASQKQNQQQQFRTYPPPQQQPIKTDTKYQNYYYDYQQMQQYQQPQQMQQYQYQKQNQSTVSNQSIPSTSFNQQVPAFQKGGQSGFFLTPSSLQFQKFQPQEQQHLQNQYNYLQQMQNQSQSSMIIHNQDSPANSLSRTTSLNQSIVGGTSAVGAGGMHSTSSKSASQDFSIQSQFHIPSHFTNIQQSSINPNFPGNTNQQTMYKSGFATPQLNTQGGGTSNLFGLFGGLNSKGGRVFGGGIQYHAGDSTLGSPIPNRGYQFETSSLHYQNPFPLECSPPYDQDDEDVGDQHHHINKLVDKLLCDDELEYRSNIDEQQSVNSNMQSPEQLFGGSYPTTALRVPIQSLIGPTNLINSSNNYTSRQQMGKQKTWSVDLMNKQGLGNTGAFTTPTVSSGSQMASSAGGGYGHLTVQQNTAVTGSIIQGTSGSASKGLLGSSNSMKEFSGVIIEGGSSSSDENKKRPSTVQEQRTEEDEGDSVDDKGGNSTSARIAKFLQEGNGSDSGKNSNIIVNNIMGNQYQQFQQDSQNESSVKNDNCLWSKDVRLFENQ